MLSVLRMSWGAGKEGRRAVWQWENAFVSTGLAFWNWQGAFVFAVVTGYLLTIPKVDLSKLVQGQVNFPAALKPTTTSARMGWLAWAFRRERGWNFLTGKTCAQGFLCSFTHSFIQLLSIFSIKGRCLLLIGKLLRSSLAFLFYRVKLLLLFLAVTQNPLFSFVGGAVSVEQEWVKGHSLTRTSESKCWTLATIFRDQLWVIVEGSTFIQLLPVVWVKCQVQNDPAGGSGRHRLPAVLGLVSRVSANVQGMFSPFEFLTRNLGF